MIWTLQDAKNKFSELVERAAKEGPQTVTKHGKSAVVVVSTQDWEELQGSDLSLADFFASSPLADSGLEIDRDASPVRSVGL